MDDKELFEQLARGPLNKNGFNDALRKKINQRIDNPRRNTARLWSKPWGRLSIALTMLLFIGFSIYSFRDEGLRVVNPDTDLSRDTESLASEPNVTPLTGEKKLRSAILIGLRKDMTSSAEGAGSSYRTILVVPEEEELVVAAEGPGIYMPYKLKFWKLDLLKHPDDPQLQWIVSTPADEADQLKTNLTGSDPSTSTEKLLYAGNQYVSILKSNPKAVKDQSSPHYWVNNVSDLTLAQRANDPDSLERLHVTLNEVMGLESSEQVIHQWEVQRSQGVWVAVAKQSPQVKPLLLTKEVTGPNSLSLSWNEIIQFEQSAIDAYSSPTEDMVAIVVEGGIHLYPYNLTKDMAPLELELAPNESIVMVQWAQDHYVDTWKKQLSSWIPPTTQPNL